MKKIITRSVIAIILLLSTAIWILFLNSLFGFLPKGITDAVDNFSYKLFNKDDDIGTTDTSDYVLLSSLSDSPLLENMDLSVPKDTYIPSQEEIDRVYKGLYADSIIASCPNYDIIVQNYGIDVTADLKLTDFRKQVVSNLEKNRPDIVFDTNFTITKGDMEIPTIEFSTTYEERDTYSFVALVDVNGKLVSISVNSADYYFDASQFFNVLLKTMVIKQ